MARRKLEEEPEDEDEVESIDPRPSDRERKHGPCELCGREEKALSFHHLIPRHCHRKRRFRDRFSLLEMRTRGLWLCRECHGGIHDLIPDEKILGWNYNTKDLLLEHEGIRRHVEWARRKK